PTGGLSLCSPELAAAQSCIAKIRDSHHHTHPGKTPALKFPADSHPIIENRRESSEIMFRRMRRDNIFIRRAAISLGLPHALVFSQALLRLPWGPAVYALNAVKDQYLASINSRTNRSSSSS